jgi:hypothetical protein
MTAQERQELIAYLESDQLVVERCRPVPRARLGRWTSAGLWALRIFEVAISAMVIYTFVAQLT